MEGNSPDKSDDVEEYFLPDNPKKVKPTSNLNLRPSLYSIRTNQDNGDIRTKKAWVTDFEGRKNEKDTLNDGEKRKIFSGPRYFQHSPLPLSHLQLRKTMSINFENELSKTEKTGDMGVQENTPQKELAPSEHSPREGNIRDFSSYRKIRFDANSPRSRTDEKQDQNLRGDPQAPPDSGRGKVSPIRTSTRNMTSPSAPPFHVSPLLQSTPSYSLAKKSEEGSSSTPYGSDSISESVSTSRNQIQSLPYRNSGKRGVRDDAAERRISFSIKPSTKGVMSKLIAERWIELHWSKFTDFLTENLALCEVERTRSTPIIIRGLKRLTYENVMDLYDYLSPANHEIGIMEAGFTTIQNEETPPLAREKQCSWLEISEYLTELNFAVRTREEWEKSQRTTSLAGEKFVEPSDELGMKIISRCLLHVEDRENTSEDGRKKANPLKLYLETLEYSLVIPPSKGAVIEEDITLSQNEIPHAVMFEEVDLYVYRSRYVIDTLGINVNGDRFAEMYELLRLIINERRQKVKYELEKILFSFISLRERDQFFINTAILRQQLLKRKIALLEQQTDDFAQPSEVSALFFLRLLITYAKRFFEISQFLCELNQLLVFHYSQQSQERVGDETGSLLFLLKHFNSSEVQKYKREKLFTMILCGLYYWISMSMTEECKFARHILASNLYVLCKCYFPPSSFDELFWKSILAPTINNKAQDNSKEDKGPVSPVSSSLSEEAQIRSQISSQEQKDSPSQAYNPQKNTILDSTKSPIQGEQVVNQFDHSQLSSLRSFFCFVTENSTKVYFSFLDFFLDVQKRHFPNQKGKIEYRNYPSESDSLCELIIYNQKYNIKKRSRDRLQGANVSPQIIYVMNFFFSSHTLRESINLYRSCERTIQQCFLQSPIQGKPQSRLSQACSPHPYLFWRVFATLFFDLSPRTIHELLMDILHKITVIVYANVQQMKQISQSLIALQFLTSFSMEVNRCYITSRLHVPLIKRSCINLVIVTGNESVTNQLIQAEFLNVSTSKREKYDFPSKPNNQVNKKELEKERSHTEDEGSLYIKSSARESMLASLSEAIGINAATHKASPVGGTSPSKETDSPSMELKDNLANQTDIVLYNFAVRRVVMDPVKDSDNAVFSNSYLDYKHFLYSFLLDNQQYIINTHENYFLSTAQVKHLNREEVMSSGVKNYYHHHQIFDSNRYLLRQVSLRIEMVNSSLATRVMMELNEKAEDLSDVKLHYAKGNILLQNVFVTTKIFMDSSLFRIWNELAKEFPGTLKEDLGLVDILEKHCNIASKSVKQQGLINDRKTANEAFVEPSNRGEKDVLNKKGVQDEAEKYDIGELTEDSKGNKKKHYALLKAIQNLNSSPLYSGKINRYLSNSLYNSNNYSVSYFHEKKKVEASARDARRNLEREDGERVKQAYVEFMSETGKNPKVSEQESSSHDVGGGKKKKESSYTMDSLFEEKHFSNEVFEAKYLYEREFDDFMVSIENLIVWWKCLKCLQEVVRRRFYLNLVIYWIAFAEAEASPPSLIQSTKTVDEKPELSPVLSSPDKMDFQEETLAEKIIKAERALGSSTTSRSLLELYCAEKRKSSRNSSQQGHYFLMILMYVRNLQWREFLTGLIKQHFSTHSSKYQKFIAKFVKDILEFDKEEFCFNFLETQFAKLDKEHSVERCLLQSVSRYKRSFSQKFKSISSSSVAFDFLPTKIDVCGASYIMGLLPDMHELFYQQFKQNISKRATVCSEQFNDQFSSDRDNAYLIQFLTTVNYFVMNYFLKCSQDDLKKYLPPTNFPSSLVQSSPFGERTSSTIDFKTSESLDVLYLPPVSEKKAKMLQENTTYYLRHGTGHSHNKKLFFTVQDIENEIQNERQLLYVYTITANIKNLAKKKRDPVNYFKKHYTESYISKLPLLFIRNVMLLLRWMSSKEICFDSFDSWEPLEIVNRVLATLCDVEVSVLISHIAPIMKEILTRHYSQIKGLLYPETEQQRIHLRPLNCDKLDEETTLQNDILMLVSNNKFNDFKVLNEVFAENSDHIRLWKTKLEISHITPNPKALPFENLFFGVDPSSGMTKGGRNSTLFSTYKSYRSSFSRFSRLSFNYMDHRASFARDSHDMSFYSGKRDSYKSTITSSVRAPEVGRTRAPKGRVSFQNVDASNEMICVCPLPLLLSSLEKEPAYTANTKTVKSSLKDEFLLLSMLLCHYLGNQTSIKDSVSDKESQGLQIYKRALQSSLKTFLDDKREGKTTERVSTPLIKDKRTSRSSTKLTKERSTMNSNEKKTSDYLGTGMQNSTVGRTSENTAEKSQKKSVSGIGKSKKEIWGNGNMEEYLSFKQRVSASTFYDLGISSPFLPKAFWSFSSKYQFVLELDTSKLSMYQIFELLSPVKLSKMQNHQKVTQIESESSLLNIASNFPSYVCSIKYYELLLIRDQKENASHFPLLSFLDDIRANLHVSLHNSTHPLLPLFLQNLLLSPLRFSNVRAYIVPVSRCAVTQTLDFAAVFSALWISINEHRLERCEKVSRAFQKIFCEIDSWSAMLSYFSLHKTFDKQRLLRHASSPKDVLSFSENFLDLPPSRPLTSCLDLASQMILSLFIPLEETEIKSSRLSHLDVERNVSEEETTEEWMERDGDNKSNGVSSSEYDKLSSSKYRFSGDSKEHQNIQKKLRASNFFNFWRNLFAKKKKSKKKALNMSMSRKRVLAEKAISEKSLAEKGEEGNVHQYIRHQILTKENENLFSFLHRLPKLAKGQILSFDSFGERYIQFLENWKRNHFWVNFFAYHRQQYRSLTSSVDVSNETSKQGDDLALLQIVLLSSSPVMVQLALLNPIQEFDTVFFSRLYQSNQRSPSLMNSREKIHLNVYGSLLAQRKAFQNNLLDVGKLLLLCFTNSKLFLTTLSNFFLQKASIIYGDTNFIVANAIILSLLSLLTPFHQIQSWYMPKYIPSSLIRTGVLGSLQFRYLLFTTTDIETIMSYVDEEPAYCVIVSRTFYHSAKLGSGDTSQQSSIEYNSDSTSQNDVETAAAFATHPSQFPKQPQPLQDGIRGNNDIRESGKSTFGENKEREVYAYVKGDFHPHRGGRRRDGDMPPLDGTHQRGQARYTTESLTSPTSEERSSIGHSTSPASGEMTSENESGVYYRNNQAMEYQIPFASKIRQKLQSFQSLTKGLFQESVNKQSYLYLRRHAFEAFDDITSFQNFFGSLIPSFSIPHLEFSMCALFDEMRKSIALIEFSLLKFAAEAIETVHYNSDTQRTVRAVAQEILAKKIVKTGINRSFHSSVVKGRFSPILLNYQKKIKLDNPNTTSTPQPLQSNSQQQLQQIQTQSQYVQQQTTQTQQQQTNNQQYNNRNEIAFIPQFYDLHKKQWYQKVHTEVKGHRLFLSKGFFDIAWSNFVENFVKVVRIEQEEEVNFLLILPLEPRFHIDIITQQFCEQVAATSNQLLAK